MFLGGLYHAVVIAFLGAMGLPLANATGVGQAAPDTAQVVEAEGACLITGDNLPAARQGAVQQALREAVERTLGVHVAAKVRVRNHVALEDQVQVRGSGHAVLEEVLAEEVDGGTYRVRIRARVLPNRPNNHAAQAAKQPLVVIGIRGESPFAHAAGLEASVVTALRAIGFGVVDRGTGGAREDAPASPADSAAWARRHGAAYAVVVTVQAVPNGRAGSLLLTARAMRASTAEVVATARWVGKVADGEDGLPARIGEHLGARLAAVLRNTQEILTEARVVVTGLDGVAQARRLEQVLAPTDGAGRVLSQEYAEGVLFLRLLVRTGMEGRLASLLEQALAAEGLLIRVESDAGGYIIARVTPPMEDPRSESER